LVGQGGWSDTLPHDPPDERENAPILPWGSIEALRQQVEALGLVQPSSPPTAR
jgi:hypothetical protein